MREPLRFLEVEAFLNVVRTHSQLVSGAEKLLKGHGISGPQSNVLRILRGHGTPVSVYQIAKEMITPSLDMPRLVDRMEVQTDPPNHEATARWSLHRQGLKAYR